MECTLKSRGLGLGELIYLLNVECIVFQMSVNTNVVYAHCRMLLLLGSLEKNAKSEYGVVQNIVNTLHGTEGRVSIYC